MKTLPANLNILIGVSPIRDDLLGGSDLLSSRKNCECHYAGHDGELPPEGISPDPHPQLESLAKGIASLPVEVASEVKVHLAADGEVVSEIPLPEGGIAWVSLGQSPADSELVVLFQSESEDVPTDITHTINPAGLVLGLEEIYSRLCVFAGADLSTLATNEASPANDMSKSETAPDSPNKGSSGSKTRGGRRKRASKRKRAKKKVRRARSRRVSGKSKKRSRRRKHKKGKR